MNQLIRFGLILGAICLVATLVLALTYEVTKPRIDEGMRGEESIALKSILPEADSFNEKKAGEIEYFDALKGNILIGYCIRVTANGYNGFMRILVGIDPNGAIKGLRVLEHQETPGLGAKVNEVLPGEKDPWFLRQFVGKNVKTVYVRKNIDAITGATISSKAVTDAVRDTVSEFMSKVRK